MKEYIKKYSKYKKYKDYEEAEMSECPNCSWSVPMDWEGNLPKHCPNCLSGQHKEAEKGYECGGILEPIGVWVKDNDEWEIIQRCSLCGEMKTTPLSEKDNRIKALSIASKPLSMPPFPIERVEELSKLTGRYEKAKKGESDEY